MKPKGNHLDYFTRLYESARSAYMPALEELDRCFTQYETGKASMRDASGVVRNISYELIEAQISSDIPRPRVSPVVRDDLHERNAEAIEVLCRDLRSRLPFERLNDLDERLTYIAGGSIWLVEWDAERNEPKLSIIDPRDFIPEPGVTELDRMSYCFVVVRKSPDELLKDFGKSVSTARNENTDSAEIVICYYKNDDGDICRYVFSGNTELSDDDMLFIRRVPQTGEPLANERITEPLRVSTGCIPRTSLPYYRPRRFPIAIRRNISRNSALLGQSDCAVIAPQQSAINRIETRIHQKLVRACVMPYMPEDCRVSPNNAVFGEVIKTDADASGSFGIIDTTPNIDQDIAQSDRLYEHARKLLGITDSYTGNSDGAALSGYAIALRVSQSAGRLRSRRIMKNALYAELDRLMLEQYLAFCDDSITLGYTDTYGKRHTPVFDRHEFLILCDDGWKYDDGYMFSVDRSVTPDDANRHSMWEITLSFFREGLFGEPTSNRARRLCWSRLEQLGYPDAQIAAGVFDTDEKPKGEEAKL